MIKSVTEAKTQEEIQEWQDRQTWAAGATLETMYSLYVGLGRAHVFGGGKLTEVKIEYNGAA